MIISSNRSSSGIGFAVPVNIVKLVAPALIKEGRFTYSYLGLTGATLSPDIAEAMNLSADQRGVLVIEAAQNGPSAKAGVRGSQRPVTIDGQQAQVGGDVIVAVDGRPVAAMDDVISYLL